MGNIANISNYKWSITFKNCESLQLWFTPELIQYHTSRKKKVAPLFWASIISIETLAYILSSAALYVMSFPLWQRGKRRKKRRGRRRKKEMEGGRKGGRERKKLDIQTPKPAMSEYQPPGLLSYEFMNSLFRFSWFKFYSHFATKWILTSNW